MGRLFGTDGIRGLVNNYPMTPLIALKIGQAASLVFKKKGNNRIIIGRDTRVSGSMIQNALISGICSAGVDVYLAEIIPTPAIAVLTRLFSANAGIVISASHNPFFDNGIKFFTKDGFKLSVTTETKIEDIVLNENNQNLFADNKIMGSVYKIPNANEKYINFLLNTLSCDKPFFGKKIVVDCSNGAVSSIAPVIFEKLGASVTTLYNKPNGININENCGSEHPENLQKKVLETDSDIGFAFDGDGDRLIAVDESGNTVGGDQIIAICAKSMKEKNLLTNDITVSTVMSNLGLTDAMSQIGVTHLKTRVGDRFVMEAMVEHNAVIGGENSGHLIFLDKHTTGDGIYAAIKLFEAVQSSGKSLSVLSECMKIYPQKLINVDVLHKPEELFSVKEIKDVIDDVEKSLNNKGRVLVRFSGTQPLCRVMVEGQDKDKVEIFCKKIAETVKKVLGV